MKGFLLLPVATSVASADDQIMVVRTHPVPRTYRVPWRVLMDTGNLIVHVTDVPDTKGDFTMFAGGVAPTTGLYHAADGNYLYTFKGGWTQWRRSPIASW